MSAVAAPKIPPIVVAIGQLAPVAYMIEADYRYFVDPAPCVGWLAQFCELMRRAKGNHTIAARVSDVFSAARMLRRQ